MLLKIFSILMFVPFSLLAQKNVDLDKFGFSVQLRSLPQVRLDSTYRTYNVDIESTRLMQPFMKEVDPERIVMVDGWRKLPEGGHVTVSVKLDDLLPESFSTVERLENIKDKTGKITGTRTFYAQEVTYTFAATAVVTDYKGMHIYDQQLISRDQKQRYRSPEFPVKQVADGYFMLNSIKLTSDLYRQNVTRAMHTLSNRLSNDFGYSAVTSNDYMWIVGSRKHPEYDAHRKAFQQMNSVLFGMDANTYIPDLKEKMKPVIDYFEGIKKRYNSTSKHDRKIRYASFFNLAVIYYYLDDPQSMMKEANGLVLNDFDSKDGKGFESVALRLKNQMQMANVTSRHFPIDVTKFKGPYETTQPVLSKTN